MKSKCSFILKAGTALVLCFLMLFGTVTTSLAAVVENAGSGANVDIASSGYEAFAQGHIYFAMPYTWTVKDSVQYCIVKNDNSYVQPKVTLNNISNTDLYYGSGSFYSNSYGDEFNHMEIISNGTGWGDFSSYNNSSLSHYTTPLDWKCNNTSNNYTFYYEDTELKGTTVKAGYNSTRDTAVNRAQYVYAYTDLTRSGTYSNDETGGKVVVTYYTLSNASTSTSNTFDTSTQSGSSYNTVPCEVTLVATPSTGYEFVGWYTAASGGTALSTNANNGITVNNTTLKYHAITKDYKIYARFRAKQYSITYKDQNNATFSGTHGTNAPTTHTYGTATTLVSPSKTGYTFDGWFTDSACTGTKVTSLTATGYTANITLYAKWTQNTYKITLSESGASGGALKVDGSAFTSGSTVTHGSHSFSITAPSNYVISSVSGIGTWSISGNTATLGSTSITEAKTISVTYAADGKPSLSAISNQSKTVNDTSFNVTTTVNDSDKKTGTLTVSASSGTTSVATVGTATLSGTTVTVPVTVKAPGTATITVTLKDGGTTVSTQKFDVTVADPTFTISGKTIYADSKDVAACTVENGGTAPSSIAWSSGTTADVAINATSGTLTAKKLGGGSIITATATYACGYTKSATATVSVANPTLTIKSTKTSGNIGDTANASINTASNPASSSIASYAWSTSDSSIVALSSTTAAAPTLTFKKNGTATISLTVTYKNNGLTKKNTNTLTIEVSEPAVSLTGSDTVAVGDSITLTPTVETVTGTPTYTYASNSTSIATVDSNGKVTGVAAGTATITVTAKLQNWSDTATATVKVEAPALIVKDGSTTLTDDSVIYTTKAVEKDLTLDKNFSDTLYAKSADEGIATVTIDNGKLKITPVAKGTTKVSVSTGSTVTPAAARMISASRNTLLGKVVNLAATGAVATQTLTFTVNVAEAEDYKLILLTGNKANNEWSSAYIHYQYKIGNNTYSQALTAMPQIGVNNDGNKVFAYKMPITHYNGMTILVFNDSSSWPTDNFANHWHQTVDITTKSNGYYLKDSYDNSTNKREIGTWTHPVTIPQVSITDVEVGVGDTATSTITNVTDISIGKTDWATGNTGIATVSDGTVTGVDVGETTLTAKVWAAKPYSNWTTWTMNDTTLAVIGSTGEANVKVTADDKVITYDAVYTDDGTNWLDATTSKGGTLTVKIKDGDAVSSGGTVPYGTILDITATPQTGYDVDGIYYKTTADGTWNKMEVGTNATTRAIYNDTFEVKSNWIFRARFKKVSYITVYNSYTKVNGKWQYTAAPPKKIEIGDGTTARATYTYSSSGTRGEEVIVNSGTTYCEGNKILVYPGEQIKLTFSGLASSDVIKGVFYNNGKRYTTESEPDNLYKNREKYTGSDTTNYWGSAGDDEWGYDYATNTTLYAAASYYTGTDASTITTNFDNYAAHDGVDQTAHTVTWIAQGDYLNIDIELGSKYQLHINDDDWSGLKIENMNDEGYYYEGEEFNAAFKISLDNTTDTTGTYAFTDTSATLSMNKDHLEPPTGVTVTAKQSNGSNATSVSNISYFLVEGKMTSNNLYVTIPIQKSYNMKLANIVVSDASSSKKYMLTETNGGTTSSTGNIGTITAIPTLNEVAGSDIASETTNLYTYPAATHNTADSVRIFTGSINNHYLKGGVNRGGTSVAAGSTITYTFTFADGKDAEYSFVGWYEGSYDGTDKFTVDYSKKLSGKTSFTYTPTKNTTVIAVGTRDMYLGGTFDKDGAYAADSTGNDATNTWKANRLLMSYDPTYVNPDDSNKIGRYYYTFDSVTANTEYKFRAYDAVSGSDSANLTVWNTWNGSTHGNDNEDIFFGRTTHDGDAKSYGSFMYKTNTNSATIGGKSSTKNHEANGYAAPVTVYFYAYDGGISVESTYQWSKAYVSEGRGVDCTNYSEVINSSATATYNTPTASVAAKTKNNKDVTVKTEAEKYGSVDNSSNKRYEKIYECTVKEKDGQIVITASPNVSDMELQAFVVYNIDTKKSWAVTDIVTEAPESGDYIMASSETANTWLGYITVPQKSNLYIVPVYKFTDTYISQNNLSNHMVYARVDSSFRDTWGGLVSMYSWGSKTDSGGWPGQLMIPSDDGESFYAPLTFGSGDLKGVTFNNYTPIYDNKHTNFLGTYDSTVSSTVYSGNTSKIAQVYDYREPIAIIENIEDGIYESEDMDLTFELKAGNKNTNPVNVSDSVDHAKATSGAYNTATSWDYLTDRSGKYRVDLNGNKLSTKPTATYYVVCNYTPAYTSNNDVLKADATNTPHKDYDFTDERTVDKKTVNRVGNVDNEYSIEWNVYSNTGAPLVSGVLSAAYTDVIQEEMLTYIASKLIEQDQPVEGKAVQIAYENPGNWKEAIRYSGQWYADGTNTIVDANVRVGVYSDGAWLPSETNSPGYGKATVDISSINKKAEGEAVSTETGCVDYSMASVTKKNATNKLVKISVDTTDNFLGWYIKNGDEFVQVSTAKSFNPSFNSDITYYAFYSASATYRVEYTARDGSTKYFTAKGSDLTEAELANNGTLDENKRTDIATQLAKAMREIGVFNRDYTVALTSPVHTTYTLTYKAAQADAQYTLSVFYYNENGSLISSPETINGTFNTVIDLTDSEIGGKDVSLVTNHPADLPYFVGWARYDGNTVGDIISSRANYGYSLTEDITIAPVFSADPPSKEADWTATVDRNVITQELTDANTGIIYNDSLIAIRNMADTGEQIEAETECGIVILAQTGGVTDEQKTSFTGLENGKMKTYLDAIKKLNGNKTSAKMNSATYGEAYAFYIPIKGSQLSRLNRADIYQQLDYAKFSGGNYKVAAYYVDKNGNTVISSNVISDTYTPHQYSRLTGERTPAAN